MYWLRELCPVRLSVTELAEALTMHGLPVERILHPWERVVGVRNMAPGDLVPYAPPGAMLPGVEGALERREIRGVASEGMLCSPKELAISADHSGILVLPPSDDLEPGADLKDALGLDEA